jgi:hypothetical protein
VLERPGDVLMSPSRLSCRSRCLQSLHAILGGGAGTRAPTRTPPPLLCSVMLSCYPHGIPLISD